MKKNISIVLVGLGLVILTSVLILSQRKETNLGFRTYGATTLMNAVQAVVSSTQNMNTKDFQDVVCSVDWDENPSSTVRFVGSIQDTAPTWANAQSSTNQYDFLDSTDMQNGNSIDGDVGYVASTTPDHRLAKIDTKYINWLSARLVTSTPAPSVQPVTVKCVGSNPLGD